VAFVCCAATIASVFAEMSTPIRSRSTRSPNDEAVPPDSPWNALLAGSRAPIAAWRIGQMPTHAQARASAGRRATGSERTTLKSPKDVSVRLTNGDQSNRADVTKLGSREPLSGPTKTAQQVSEPLAVEFAWKVLPEWSCCFGGASRDLDARGEPS
jgi:hypothetical protein